MLDPGEALEARYGAGRTEHPVLGDASLSRILARRTHRRYAPQAVEPGLVDALLDVAFSASSKSDYQQASVVVVRDPSKRKALADLVPAMPWIGVAPAFLVFCADCARLEAVAAARGHRLANRNLEAFFNASVDAALAMQTFILAAEQVGLGCCPISVIRNHLAAVVRILDLPEAVAPVAGLCVGYPAEEGFISMRLPPEVVRHVDGYREDGSDTALASYDRTRSGRAPTPQEKQREPARFGFVDDYGWREDKARQALAGEGAGFGQALRQHGFTLD